jgi:DNA-binding transcriptional ArsR family regulator
VESLFDMLADPGRRQILDLLLTRERAAGEIVEAMRISQPGVSKHLKLLREAGLVEVRGEGQRRIYSLRPEPFVELDQWLAPYRAFWSGKLDALGAHLNREQ